MTSVRFVFAMLFLVGCSSSLRRFPLKDPVWNGGDQKSLQESPSKYYSGIRGDAVDKLALRPLTDLFAFQLPHEAQNVNALDEVPNSSWFENRIGWFDISPEQAARAECRETAPLNPEGPWMVVGAKPDGANPGFIIEARDGYRYLLKFDGHNQPLRATTADVVGSKLYWLIGYHSVCNEIVNFDPGILQIAPGATTETDTGDERPMVQSDVRQVLMQGFRLKDGRVRASASRFVPGKPIGPFRYEGRRYDDPNDKIAHEERRELRAAHLPAAWINHVDAREQNTLNVIVEEGERKFVRHYKIDWGDALGIGWNPDRLGRRLGYSYAVDFQQMAEDFFTLGLLDRPWNSAERTKVHIFGYYDVARFKPSAWRGVYPIPAFEQRTPRDILWMLRIFSRITDEHIRAIVSEARLPDERQADYLIATLIGRRDRFFAEYLQRYVPLGSFFVVRRDPGNSTQSLCFDDLAILHGVADPNAVYYQLRFYGGLDGARELGWVQFNPDPKHPAWSCIRLPLGEERPSQLASEDSPLDHPLRYGVMKIWVHQVPSVRPMGEVRVHFYDLGPDRGFQMVGVERPEHIELPDDY